MDVVQKHLCTILIGGCSVVVCVILLVLFVVYMCYPPGYTMDSWLQMNTLSIVEEVDSFWYDRLTVDYSGTVGVSAVVDCSKLKYHCSHSNWSSTTFSTIGNRLLTNLERVSYLGKGSSVQIQVNRQPSNQHVTLYLFNNYTAYKEYALVTTHPPLHNQYLKSYTIADAPLNITVNKTGFYFFLVYVSSPINMSYQYSLDRYSLSSADYYPTGNSSELMTNVSSSAGGDKHCLLLQPIKKNSFEIISVKVHTSRRPFNALTTSLLLFAGTALLVFVAAIAYKFVQHNLGPWCSRDCIVCKRK